VKRKKLTQKFMKKKFIYVFGVVCILIGVVVLLVTLRERIQETNESEEDIQSVREYETLNYVYFTQQMDAQMYEGLSGDEAMEVYQNAFRDGGVSYEEFVQVDDLIGFSQDVNTLEVDVYFANDVSLSVPFSADAGTFVSNINQEIVETQGYEGEGYDMYRELELVTDESLDAIKIVSMFYKSDSHDTKVIELAYVFEVDSEERLIQSGIDTIAEVLETGDYSLLTGRVMMDSQGLLAELDPYTNYSDYRKSLHEYDKKNVLKLERCKKEYLLKERAFLTQQNQEVWDQKKNDHAEFVRQIKDRISTTSRQGGEQLLEGCEKQAYVMTQVEFAEAVTLEELKQLESIIPIMYSEHYDHRVDPDYFDAFYLKQQDGTEPYSYYYDRYNETLQGYSLGETIVFDVDAALVIKKDGSYQREVYPGYTYQTNDFVAQKIFEPGGSFEDLETSYREPKYDVKGDNIEPCPQDCGKELFTDSDEVKVDIVKMYADALTPNLQCIQSLVETGDEATCQDFRLNTSDKETIKKSIQAVKVQYVEPGFLQESYGPHEAIFYINESDI
jgi:hypothetical protein